MNLNQLTILDAIVQSSSLSQAAVTLHKTQPALTLAIKKLESELGFELLDRNQYRLCLTEKGRIFIVKHVNYSMQTVNWLLCKRTWR